jgi:hypothetical protein
MVLPFSDGDCVDDTDGATVGAVQPTMNSTRDAVMKTRIVDGISLTLMGTSFSFPDVAAGLAC